jgi:hypothetical protein
MELAKSKASAWSSPGTLTRPASTSLKRLRLVSTIFSLGEKKRVSSAFTAFGLISPS